MRWSLDQCLACDAVRHVVVVAPAEWLLVARETVADAAQDAGRNVTVGHPLSLSTDVVAGGADRRASVAAGLAALDEADGIVLVHDAARALAPPALFQRVIDGLRSGHGAVIPGLPVVDTIKAVDSTGAVVQTFDRSGLRAVQTPQGFIREVLVHAHGENLGAAVTDDAGLVEMTGAPIHMVEGEPWAHKITTPEDLELAERRLVGLESRP